MSFTYVLNKREPYCPLIFNPATECSHNVGRIREFIVDLADTWLLASRNGMILSNFETLLALSPCRSFTGPLLLKEICHLC